MLLNILVKLSFPDNKQAYLFFNCIWTVGTMTNLICSQFNYENCLRRYCKNVGTPI